MHTKRQNYEQCDGNRRPLYFFLEKGRKKACFARRMSRSVDWFVFIEFGDRLIKFLHNVKPTRNAYILAKHPSAKLHPHI